MSISKTDLETISSILKIGKLILKEYDAIDTEEFSKDELLALLNAEDELYESLELTSGLIAEIETMIANKIGIRFSSSLPNGISPYMTENAYPYIRLLARTRYFYKEKQTTIDEAMLPRFLDLEIGLFHKSLMLDSEMNPDVSEKLKRYASMILIDSPRIERKIVQNDMAPLEKIDDYLGFCVDLWSTYLAKKAVGQLGYPGKESVLKKRQDRANILLEEMDTLTKRYEALRNQGKTDAAELAMSTSYFKAIIACQPPKRRKEMYSAFEANHALEMSEDKLYRINIKRSQTDIEETLSPSIWKFEFVDRQKMM